ncbi:MAG: formate dehydrogenase accessory sulfurtransferase FdhD [Rectinema sp.]
MNSTVPPLAPERGVELRANGARVATLLCTPENLEDLAWGHLASRGFLDLDAVLSDSGRGKVNIRVCGAGALIEVDDSRIRAGEGLGLGAIVASGCGAGAGAGAEELDRLLFAPAVSVEWTVDMETLRLLAKAMFARADMYRETGGMHCAAAAYRLPDDRLSVRQEGLPPGWSMVVREDVGRHNAVDKVLGRILLEGGNPSECVLLTSGRIAADMALKAVNCRVPVVVSRSIPTTTAYELAVRGGITLVGRIGSENPALYTHPERIR